MTKRKTNTRRKNKTKRRVSKRHSRKTRGVVGGIYASIQNFNKIKQREKSLLLSDKKKLLNVLGGDFLNPYNENRHKKFLHITREGGVGELILTLDKKYVNEIPSSDDDSDLILTFVRESTSFLEKTGVYRSKNGSTIYMSDNTLQKILSDASSSTTVDIVP